MRGSSAPGVCHWFRTRTLPRVVARLCATVLFLNMFAPIAWAALAPPSPPPVSAAHRHDPAPDPHAAHHGSHHHPAQHSAEHGSPAGDPATPAGHDSHSDDSGGLTPHCPLCVLFGGSAWAPLLGTAAITTTAPVVTTNRTIGAKQPTLPLPLTLRPSPRGPPSPL